MSPATYTYGGKKKMTANNPFDYGQEALYGPGGYQGAPSPIYDWGSLFAGNGPGQPPGGAGPGGGRGNAYRDLINQMLNQQRADFGAESAADAAGRDAAIKRLLISYGETPDIAGLGSEAQGVLGNILKDSKIGELAAQNTAEGTSVKARIDAANQIALRQVGQAGAARGTLRSGDTGYRLGQQALQDKQTRFDTLNELAGNIEGSVGTFAAAERARQRSLAEAENAAAMAAFQFADDTDLSGGGGETGPAGTEPGGDPYPWVTQAYNEQQAKMRAQAQARAAAAARARAEAARRARSRLGGRGGAGGGTARVL